MLTNNILHFLLFKAIIGSYIKPQEVSDNVSARLIIGYSIVICDSKTNECPVTKQGFQTEFPNRVSKQNFQIGFPENIKFQSRYQFTPSRDVHSFPNQVLQIVILFLRSRVLFASSFKRKSVLSVTQI